MSFGAGTGGVNSRRQRRLQQRLAGGDRHGVVLAIEGQAKTLDQGIRGRRRNFRRCLARRRIVRRYEALSQNRRARAEQRPRVSSAMSIRGSGPQM